MKALHFPRGLYVVPVPIGNMQDITLRALHVLAGVCAVACEDKRVTAKLFHAHQLHTPLIPYHDHNGTTMRPLLLSRIQKGESIALVSDGGMPLISDPGYKLVQACIEASLPVHVLPGPSASLTALCLSGLPPDRFFFQGFLPATPVAREKSLKLLASFPVTLIFFEAPHRLCACLKSMEKILGNRSAAVMRELTKTYENVQRGQLSTLIQFYTNNPPKGEIVVAVQGATNTPFSTDPLDDLLKKNFGTEWKKLPIKQIVHQLADQTGKPKREIYQQLSRIREHNEEGRKTS